MGGALRTYSQNCSSGTGSAGTSYSGGSGGGGTFCNGGAGNASSGVINGGAGGKNFRYGESGSGGGAGNPGGLGTVNGSSGTGGLLTIYANGYINKGTITSDGSTGGASYVGGGSSGGGSINIFTNQSTNINQLGIVTNTRYNEIKGTTSNIGGVATGSSYKGGTGGSGTLNIGAIRNGQYYDLIAIIEQDKAAYVESVTIRGDSILSILNNNDLKSGYYYFIANGVNYPVHLYTYDGDQTWTTNMTFGDSKDVATASTYAQNMVVVKVNGNLTIGSGKTVTAYRNNYGGPKGFTLYVTGTLTNNGTITMTARGAKAVGQNVYLWKNNDGTYEYVPAVGGAGGGKRSGSYKAQAGIAGTPGSSRRTGGGGGGAIRTYIQNCSSGTGSAGTSYSGGSGGGGTFCNGGTGNAGSGTANGGAGGKNFRYGESGSGGGAGNPGGSGTVSGSSGTGGLLNIYANNYVNKGTVSSNGSNGGASYAGGGSSGGGSINIFYSTSVTVGTVQRSGGSAVGTSYKGGAGGAGTVTYKQIPFISMTSAFTYPELTSSGFENEYSTVTANGLSTLEKIMYSLDSGITWIEYTEPFKVEAGAIVQTKGVYSDTTETAVVSHTSATATNYLPRESCDNNSSTNSTIAASSSSIFTVTDDIVGKSLRFFLNSTPASDASIKIYDSSNKELLSTTFVENLTVMNIPENSYKIIINAGSSDLIINEINIREEVIIKNNIPAIETSSVEWTTSKTIEITYPEGYTNEYSLDLGETWLEYLSPITVENETIILARTVENGKVVSSSSFKVTKIDTTEPTITLDIPDEIIYKTEYNLPTSYTVDETKSGGSAICKIGENEITNTKDLEIGTHEITCTVTTGAGKEASVSKTINIIDEPTDITLDIPDSIVVGSSYSLPTTVTGSTYSCKIGETECTNTKDLSIGIHEIVCSVTSIGGNTKEVTKQIEVLDEDIDISLDDLPDSIIVGSSYNLPTTVTGSSYSCKIGETEYTNTKDLSVGTHEIVCSVTSIGGNTKEVTKQIEVYETVTSTILNNNKIIEATPTLTTSSNNTTDASGLYKSTDTNDGSPTYYFRGNVTNNYVDFAGFTWRIIRINEDGTIRMIMTTGINGDDSYYKFNSDTGIKESMYYSKSNVKTQLTTWYNTNIASNSNYSEKVATGDYYCEQAKVAYKSSYATGSEANMILYSDSKYKPDFKCEKDANGFGIVNANVGLITYEELLYAGGYYNEANTTYYLNKHSSFWTMSPAGYSGLAYLWDSSGSVSINYHGVGSSYRIYPVINLKSDVTVTGTGESNNHYVVE